MKVKVGYTVLGWIDMDVPEGLTSKQIEELTWQKLQEECSDGDIIDGLVTNNFGIDADQIEIDHIETEIVDSDGDTEHLVLYDKKQELKIHEPNA